MFSTINFKTPILFWTVSDLPQGSHIMAIYTNYPFMLWIIHIREEWYLRLWVMSIQKQKWCWIFVKSRKYTSIINKLENINKNCWCNASFGRVHHVAGKVYASEGASWSTWEIFPRAIVLLPVDCWVIRTFCKYINPKSFLHCQCLQCKQDCTEYCLAIACHESKSSPMSLWSGTGIPRLSSATNKKLLTIIGAIFLLGGIIFDFVNIQYVIWVADFIF